MQLKSTNAVFLQTKREYFIVYLFRSFLERFCLPLFIQERGSLLAWVSCTGILHEE